MAASSQDPPSVAVRPLPRQTPEVGAVCGKPARTDLSGGRSALDVPTAIEPMAIAACGRLHGDARMRRWCATAFVTSMVVLLPRPPYGERTTASARATVVAARQTRRRPIAASIARGMKTCRRRKPPDAGMIGRQGVFQIKNGPKRTALENFKTAGASRRTT